MGSTFEERTIRNFYCDQCGEENSYAVAMVMCLGCKDSFCRKCAKVSGKFYPGGSAPTGYFCSKCEGELPRDAIELHDLYLIVSDELKSAQIYENETKELREELRPYWEEMRDELKYYNLLHQQIVHKEE